MNDDDDDDDPLGAARGFYVAFLLMALFYSIIAIVWVATKSWPLW